MRSSRHSTPKFTGRAFLLGLFALMPLFALIGAPAQGALVSNLMLHPEPSAATDLAVTIPSETGAPATSYIRWSDLAKLPTSHLTLTGEFVPGEQEVTVVYLSDLWAVLPRPNDVDTLLATCSDGYAGVFRADFIARFRPFLILEINRRGPEHWPPPGLTFNPGPYVITVASQVVPAVATLLDAGHKRPWGVTSLTLTRYSDAFGVFFRAPWDALSPRAEAGRELWIHSCASCHQGPKRAFGGTKSGVAFEILAARALHAPDVFKQYIRDPKSIVANAKMQPHPDYTAEQLAALQAFVTAEPAR